MKILLINTPRSPFNAILENAPDEARPFIHKKLIGPPMGLLTLAAAVKDHEVVVFDTKGEYDLYPESPPLETMVAGLLEKHKPDIVATTVISSEFYYGLQILQTAKNFNPRITTVIGGLHVTLCIEDCNHPAVDVAIRGHAGSQFRDLVQALERSKGLDSVPGLYIRNGTALKATAGIPLPWHPAGRDFLMPDRSLLERWRNTYWVKGAPSPTTYLFTSLGCPYQCSFCSIWREHCGIYHQRELDSILDELRSIDYEIVRFADANTIVNVDFIDRLFSRIETEGIRKEYIMDIRADTAVAHPKLIEKLARNGLKVVICGFESFNEAELNKYNKNSKPDDIEKAIRIFHANGIMLRGNYVIPTDYSLADFRAMADYAGRHKVAYAGYTILTPMPGTVYYDEVKNDIIDHDLRKYNFFNPVLPTKLKYAEFCRQVGALWLIKRGKDVI